MLKTMQVDLHIFSSIGKTCDYGFDLLMFRYWHVEAVQFKSSRDYCNPCQCFQA